MTEDRVTETLKPPAAGRERLLAPLRRYQRGRIGADAVIRAFGAEAVIHRGVFAAALA